MRAAEPRTRRLTWGEARATYASDLRYATTKGGAEMLRMRAITVACLTLALGVAGRVVRDVVTEEGEPVEVTDDWYAQDSDGNIWYLGEDTAEYENGRVVSRSGSFEAGVDGAEAGIAMPAQPEVGPAYPQGGNP